MALRNAAITTGGTIIFDISGAGEEHAVTCLIFCNIDNSNDVNLDLAATPSGGNLVKMINSLTIPAGETFTFDTEKLVLSTGDTITATASFNNRLVVTVSSMRVG